MDLAERRDETADALRADLAGVESGEGPSRFAAGHGLMSRVFRFEWREPSLEIDLALPFARVLLDEESQGEDAARRDPTSGRAPRRRSARHPRFSRNLFRHGV